MTTENRVAVGFNNMMGSDQAAKVLGCSYSHMINLLKSKKVKGQMKNKRWLVDSDDVYRAKSTGLVKPRPGSIKRAKAASNSPSIGFTTAPESSNTKVQLEFDKHKLDVIRLALKNTTVNKYIETQINSLYEKIQSRLDGLEL